MSAILWLIQIPSNFKPANLSTQDPMAAQTLDKIHLPHFVHRGFTASSEISSWWGRACTISWVDLRCPRYFSESLHYCVQCPPTPTAKWIGAAENLRQGSGAGRGVIFFRAGLVACLSNFCPWHSAASGFLPLARPFAWWCWLLLMGFLTASKRSRILVATQRLWERSVVRADFSVSLPTASGNSGPFQTCISTNVSEHTCVPGIVVCRRSMHRGSSELSLPPSTLLVRWATWGRVEETLFSPLPPLFDLAAISEPVISE